VYQKIVATAAEIGEKWAGIPGVELTPGGRLYFAWFSGGENEPQPENEIYLRYSDDKGATLSPPEKMAVKFPNARTFDPTLWLAPSGELWLIFNRGNKETAEHGVFARICADPDAAHPVWSDEWRLGYEAPFSFRMNKPTVLSTGEWIMPVTHSAVPNYGWFSWAHQRQGVGISRDQGKTWSLHGAVEAPEWALENMIIERRDGSLAMYMRAGGGAIWLSDSHDGGVTWSEGHATDIPNPCSRFYIRQLPAGDWLLINSPDPTKRTGIAVSLSSDEGATWRGSLVLDTRDNVSYPDAAIAPDGTVYAVHDRDRGGVGEILLDVFRLEDIG
jgi:predicted neuraminidase